MGAADRKQPEIPASSGFWGYDRRRGFRFLSGFFFASLSEQSGYAAVQSVFQYLPKQEDFVLDGVILIGNRHNYVDRDDTKEIAEYFASKGYLKEGINSSFYLNEYIGVYMDTKYNGNENDVRILVVPHKTIEEHEKDDLELIASEKGSVMNYTKPDENNYKYVNEGYVSIDYPEGKYDILFTYKEKIAYFININLTKEPTE